MLEKLINPGSIAIIGASNDPSKPGGKLLQNILTGDYSGRIYPVNPKHKVIQQIPAFNSIQDLPTIPDIAFIAIPAKYVQHTLEEVAEKGVKIAVVLSAGFGEVSESGKIEEQHLAQIANEHNMFLLGPNCSGILTYSHASKFTSFMPEMTPKGIDIISGSGATIDFLAEQAVRRGVPLRSLLTVGNAAQTGVTEILAQFDGFDSPSIPPIKLLYTESITNPQSFLKHARNLNKAGCFITGIKAGTSVVGSRAAVSHTGAMATDDTAVQALFDKAGIIRAPSRLELIDIACALLCTKGKNDGRRVCVISDAGGPAVMLADELSNWNFVLPPLQESTREQLTAILPIEASVANPIDCLPTRTNKIFQQIIDIIATEEADNIDYILLVIGDPGLSNIAEIYDVVSRAMERYTIPILPTFCSILTTSTSLYKYRQAGKSYFEDEVSMARALGRIVNRPKISTPNNDISNFDQERIEEILQGESGVVSPQKTRLVLTAAGLSFPKQQALTEVEQLATVDIPFPWVMKVMGPLHKSDVGGVTLGIDNLDQARKVMEELLKIDGAYGCLIQEMAEGLEVIIGTTKEGEFGQLVMFGLGGIFTEALGDVNFCMAPLSDVEAEWMIYSSKIFPLIKGSRGKPGMDMDKLRDWLIRIGHLVDRFPQIQEMDLNPVKGYGSELYVVDARLIIET